MTETAALIAIAFLMAFGITKISNAVSELCDSYRAHKYRNAQWQINQNYIDRFKREYAEAGEVRYTSTLSPNP